MFSNSDRFLSGPVEALNTPGANIIGTGLTPEGIETNDIIFELMNEMGWNRQPVDPQLWTKAYSQRYSSLTLASVSFLLILFKVSKMTFLFAQYKLFFVFVSHFKVLL